MLTLRNAPTKKADKPVPSFELGIDGKYRTVWGSAKDAVKTILDPGLSKRQKAGLGASREQILNLQKLANELGVSLKKSGVNDWLTRRFARTFQDCYMVGPYASGMKLVVDGDPGAKTSAAVDHCRENKLRVSDHFFWREFKTNGPQILSSDNHVILAHRSKIAAAEKLRAILIRNGKTTDAKGLSFASAYRSKVWNKHIGGASRSRHMSGDAVDLNQGYRITEAEAVEAGFTGLGFLSRRNPIVLHADTRNRLVRRIVRWYYT